MSKRDKWDRLVHEVIQARRAKSKSGDMAYKILVGVGACVVQDDVLSSQGFLKEFRKRLAAAMRKTASRRGKA